MKEPRRRPFALLVLALAVLLTAAFVLVPRLPVRAEIPASEVRIVAPHGLVWTPADATVRCSKDDPHFELLLPKWAQATTELTFVVEPIWGNVGTFQFFNIPTDSAELHFNEGMVVNVEAKIYGGPYLLKAIFPEPIARLRLDPPDGAQFIVRSVIVHGYPGRVPLFRNTLGWLALAAWLGGVGWRFFDRMRALVRWTQQRPRAAVLAALIVVGLARVWLTADQPLKAVGGAMHDDLLFIRQAASILDGHWLGAYNNLTLAKGQGYPLWIVAMYLLHVPLVLAQHLLYVGVAALGYAAWRPAMPRLWRLLVAGVVMFNPASFHGDDAARILRNHFSASLALLTFVCVTGWFLRLREARRKQLGWAAGAGAAGALLWITREETVWMAGVIALVALAGAWQLRTAGREGWRTVGLVALLPVGIGVAVVTAICALNYSSYRFWGTVEFRAAPFKDAYGALSRIKVGPWRQYVPVSREMREAAYAVSPAFRKMQPFLEGSLGEGWASLGTATTGLPASERQIHGAAFMWALRDGAAAAWQHASCEQAMVYYREIADEINAACDSGKLPALPRRSGFVPPWRHEYTEQLPGTFLESWKFITTFIYVVPKPPPSSGPDEAVALFAKLSRTPLSPRPGDPPLPASEQRSEAFRDGVLKDVTRLYAFLVPAAVILALPALGLLWILVVRGRAPLATAVLPTAALAGAVALTLVVSLVQVTSFVAITIGYQAAAYPLVLLFVTLSFAGIVHALLHPESRPGP